MPTDGWDNCVASRANRKRARGTAHECATRVYPAHKHKHANKSLEAKVRPPNGPQKPQKELQKGPKRPPKRPPEVPKGASKRAPKKVPTRPQKDLKGAPKGTQMSPKATYPSRCPWTGPRGIIQRYPGVSSNDTPGYRPMIPHIPRKIQGFSPGVSLDDTPGYRWTIPRGIVG